MDVKVKIYNGVKYREDSEKLQRLNIKTSKALKL